MSDFNDTVSTFGMNDRGIGQDGTIPTGPNNEVTLGNDPTLTGGSGGGVPDWLKQFLPANMGGTGDGASAMMIPALLTAMQQHKNAGQYTDLAEKYAGQLDPFASQRGGYQDQLKNFMSDPQGYISKMPSYQAALNLGLGALNRGNMKKQGNVTNADDVQYASQLGAQTFDQMMGRLTPLTGAQFGPGASAAILQTGMQGKINSQNAALQAAMFPFFNKSNPTTVNNTTTTPGTTTPGGLNPGFGGGGTVNPGSPGTINWGPGANGNQSPNWDGSANPDGNGYVPGDGAITDPWASGGFGT